MQLFYKMAEDNGTPKTVTELAELTNCDPVLLSNLWNLLQGLIKIS